MIREDAMLCPKITYEIVYTGFAEARIDGTAAGYLPCYFATRALKNPR
jgi:hypothetical protein